MVSGLGGTFDTLEANVLWQVTGAIGYNAETSHYQQWQEAAESEWMF